MKVAQIIQGKSSLETFTIKQSQTVEEAAGMLSSLRIGALIVSDDGNHIDGILSERDIVRELGAKGSGLLQGSVQDIMTADVKTVDSDIETRQAMRVMSESGIRHLPVVDNGQLKGMISIRDVISARLKEMESENSALTEMISGTSY